MNAYQRVIEAFRDAGLAVKERGTDRASCQGPGHSVGDYSVLVSYQGDQALIYSYAGQDTDEILDAIGLRYRDLFDSDKGVDYEYPDGRTVHRSVDKKFFQRGNTTGDQLYHVDKLADADTVYVVGGEKDVHTLEYNGLTATCNAGGEQNIGSFDLRPLLGKKVIVVRDNDDVGVKFAKILIREIGAATEMSVVTAAVGKDATDHFAADHGPDDFTPDPQFAADFMLAELRLALAKAEDEALPADKLAVRISRAIDAATPLDDAAGLVGWGDLSEEWWNSLHEASGEPIPTPWEEVNTVLANGFYRGRSYLFGARPGRGKSLTLTNFASYAAHHGHRGALYSVEMGRIEIASRIIASGAHTEYARIMQRNMDLMDLERIGKFTDNAKDIPLYVCDNERVTMAKIRRDCRALKAHGGLDFVCVDYLQLLSSELRGQSRQEQLSEISRALKMLAKELDIVVVSACQLNRGNEKDARLPALSDLRESGSLEQDCDVAILLHRPDNETGMVDFIVAKNRTGAETVVSLPWRAQYARIGE